YLTKEGGGIFEYERLLSKALDTKAEMGTQVDDLVADPLLDGTRYVPVEELIRLEAGNARRASARLGAWGEGTHPGWVGFPGEGSSFGVSPRSDMDRGQRTYKGHLQRTRDAHERYNAVAAVLQSAFRYNAVAAVLQSAFRCHRARLEALEAQRNPSHLRALYVNQALEAPRNPSRLRALYVNQINAFATLIQCNARTMLARLRAGLLAGQKALSARQVNAKSLLAGKKALSARQEWYKRRVTAARRIQAFFLLKCGARKHSHVWAGAVQRRAALRIQRAARAHAAVNPTP
ncbi:hypothetical protein T484DRAFT_1784470, partial [Baffinella frigidus]